MERAIGLTEGISNMVNDLISRQEAIEEMLEETVLKGEHNA